MGYYAVQGNSTLPISVPIESVFLLLINTNLHPISYSFEVIADYCSNMARKTVTCVIESPLGAWATYTLFILGSFESSYSELSIRVHKLRTFLLGVTAVALRTNIDW